MPTGYRGWVPAVYCFAPRQDIFNTHGRREWDWVYTLTLGSWNGDLSGGFDIQSDSTLGFHTLRLVYYSMMYSTTCDVYIQLYIN